MFVGVNQTTDNMIYGTFSYDGSNINVDFVKQVPALGGYARNPRFTIDAVSYTHLTLPTILRV